MKTRGWFQKLVLSLVAVLAFDVWALGLDFEKEIQKREVVSVRLAEDMKRTGASNPSESSARSKGGVSKETHSGTFSVRLMPAQD